MYNTLILSGALIVLALLLVHFKPLVPLPVEEGFATAAVDPIRMPACAERSAAAQSLLARIAAYPPNDEAAGELRLLISKLCCMEADVAAPVPGVYRTQNLQFRTQEDTEPASTIVGRCLRSAVNKRDIEIITEKFSDRGHVLIGKVCQDPADKAASKKDLDEIVARLRLSMTSFCVGAPNAPMDRPVGPRDMGFWETEAVAELSQYQGPNAVPKSEVFVPGCA
jgi:hypothetical protein